ncbi:prepilin peptidase [Clostridium magnum]|uniref:Type 4 prepilin-like proteins leader peptide-processing enzyme n=1 Tax=Clostridium magnum DSM 2767 TaxID=1121326 RepID=A0A162U3L7_9CLOT|nr:A24 family peptidase [Clostridium magnum]KZL93394.1 type 4 prepilin-like proteins leader peptide-processing enzyme [Clostridium magnum DSM 2767]SHI15915.1 type 4 prepilin peptidase 1 . Aspartic peptidase. MEROPS family A24A [Clostridium magnum DSM 2767]
MIILFGIIFIFGAIIGSFLNVCIYRIPREESIVYPPSSCTTCKNVIKGYDLVPIISYLFLKGKCRYCGEKVSIRYPIIEFTTGILFVITFIKFGISLDFAKYIVLISLLVVVSMIDLDTTDVYFSTTLTGIISSAIFLGIYLYMDIPIGSYIYGGVIGGGLLSLIILITKGGMGWGDAEICLVCGLFLGLKLTIIMLFLSFIIGSVIGLLLILSGKKSKKDYIPFGPFIAIAAIVTIFVGERIWVLYTSLIF